MKTLLPNPARLLMPGLQVLCITILLFLAGCKKNLNEPKLKITTVATGLVNPLGIEVDKTNNIWVTETGTGDDDGKVIVVKPNGVKYDAIVNLSSVANEAGTEIEGAAHLLLDGNILYVLSGNYLYKANIANFKPGDKPLEAANIPSENVGEFVLSYPFVNNFHDTHPYNLTKGPEGDLYIADAGANAIIHRTAPGVFKVLAEVPGITNPTTVGPPKIESVPTSIIYDGKNFLVTSLLGFPFPSGKALIHKISTSGNVSVYQSGFTSLVDIAKGSESGHVALQYATFGPMGFAANSGALVWADGINTKEITSGLNSPVGLKQDKDDTWYVTTMNDGKILKITYK